MSKSLKDLSVRQQMFVREYLIDLNATQAAIRAGYSKKTAGSQGERLLNRSDIKAIVQKKMDERATRVDITADRVLEEIAKLAFSNINDFVDWSDGAVSIRASAGIDNKKLGAISEVSESATQNGSNIKVKMHDKVRALELAGKHLKLFTDKVEHSGKVRVIVRDLTGDGQDDSDD